MIVYFILPLAFLFGFAVNGFFRLLFGHEPARKQPKPVYCRASWYDITVGGVTCTMIDHGCLSGFCDKHCNTKNCGCMPEPRSL